LKKNCALKFFNNKCVWIVGASSGIGEALALELSAQKANIVISSRDEEKLKILAEKCRKNGSDCLVLPLDLKEIDSFDGKVDQVISVYHHINHLIISSGISQRSYIAETSLELDREIMEVNYFGNIALTKAVLPYMLKQRLGHISVVSSIVGVFGFPLRSAYSASKHALHGFYETLRAEHQQDGMSVSIIIPGRVRTNISLNALDKDGQAYNKIDDGQAAGISSEKAAGKILKGIQNNKKEILVGGSELFTVYLRRYLPYLFYKMISKIKTT